MILVAIMKDRGQLLLNVIAIFSFILYGIGIYLHVGILGTEWGNIAVDLALDILGPLMGIIIVIVIGAFILLITFQIHSFQKINVFLCWFWVFSLYQCAINSFLQFYDLPDEPINQFFKLFFPSFWYPAKEIVFGIIAILLTFFWVRFFAKQEFSKLDCILIALTICILVGGTIVSQLLF